MATEAKAEKLMKGGGARRSGDSRAAPAVFQLELDGNIEYLERNGV